MTLLEVAKAIMKQGVWVYSDEVKGTPAGWIIPSNTTLMGQLRDAIDVEEQK